MLKAGQSENKEFHTLWALVLYSNMLWLHNPLNEKTKHIFIRNSKTAQSIQIVWTKQIKFPITTQLKGELYSYPDYRVSHRFWTTIIWHSIKNKMGFCFVSDIKPLFFVCVTLRPAYSSHPDILTLGQVSLHTPFPSKSWRERGI